MKNTKTRESIAHLEIICDGDAFQGNTLCPKADELSRILRGLADRLQEHPEDTELGCGPPPLFDRNGNRVGLMQFFWRASR